MARRPRLEQTRPHRTGRPRGLVSSRRSGDRIHARSYVPSPDLRHVVASYWAGRWDLRGEPPHVTEMLGDPCAHFVFEGGEAGTSCRLVGVWTRLWRRSLEGVGNVRGVKLRPGAVSAFLEPPATRYANCIVPLPRLFPEARALEPGIVEPDDDHDEEGFAVLETWLRDRLRPEPDAARSRAIRLAEQIAGDPELVSAQQLADAARISLRALQRLFRDHVGASPKWVIRRHRLQEVAARIERGESPTLAALAAELGYADQAHLTRDFKRVVGRTPSQFASSVHE